MNKHYHSRRGKISRTYCCWCNMLQRCEQPKNKDYARYGGREIWVCAEWHRFDVFLADMGEAPKGLTLGRRDNNGPYCKSNCCWQTRLEQSANTSRNRFVSVDGETHHVSDWARILKLNRHTLWTRIQVRGAERAIRESR